MSAPGGIGNAVAITFSFPISVPPYASVSGFQAFNAEQILATRQILASIEEITQINFIETAGLGQVILANSSQPPSQGGYAYSPSYSYTYSGSTILSVTENESGGDVWINRDISWSGTAWIAGNGGYSTLLHEFGHTLGLKHPFEASIDGYFLDSSLDDESHTVMSYTMAPHSLLLSVTGTETGYSWQTSSLRPSTLMPLDVESLQYLYGANLTAHSGNDTYQWASNPEILATLWDSGGIDTFDCSNQTLTCIINLQEGSYSSISYRQTDAEIRQGLDLPAWFAQPLPTGIYDGSNNIALAKGTVIENANGGSAADTLMGNSAANFLKGGGGNDAMFGYGASDTLSGGEGNDAVDGGEGSDTADYSSATVGIVAEIWRGTITNDGQGGVDTITGIENLSGGIFNDLLAGNSGANVLSGLAGNDRLLSYEGNDTLSGGAGNDTLAGGSGNDALDGGADSDTADCSSATAGIVAEIWRGTITNDGQGGVDTITGIENLTGGNLNDLLAGNSGANVLTGLGGNDRLLSYEGNDTVSGGAGSDTADYGSATVGIVAEIWRGTVTNDGQGGVDTILGIENLTGGNFNDLLAGNSVANGLSGLGGNDRLLSYEGNDTLNGGAGNDTMTGGSGNDSLDGGSNSDTADYGSATSGVVAEIWRGTITNDGQGGVDTIAGIENLTGGNYNDLLAGNFAANGLSGLGGNDRLLSYEGNDTLNGGAGNDTLEGGPGSDTADYGSAAVGIVAELWRGSITNDGQGGVDTITGIENLTGGNFNDLLAGNSGANGLSGLGGNDRLLSYEGNDTLNGGAGNDTLEGGSGNDVFVFDAAPGAGNVDTIVDFASGADVLQLENGILTALAATGPLAAGSLRTGGGVTTAADADDFLIYNSTTGALYYDGDASGSTFAALQFATLANHAAIAASDFGVV